jgi:hypothetical protein
MENDKEMAEYIYSILLMQPSIIMSWGFYNPRIIKQGLSFHVNGFKHKGSVKISNCCSTLINFVFVSIKQNY